jgi:ABC-type amino acid transport substrate-binding protein
MPSHRNARTGMCVGAACVALMTMCYSGTSSATPAVLASYASAASGLKLVKSGYLTVALVAGNLPNIAAGPDGTLQGGDGAWLQQAAKDLGLKIATFPTTVSGQILAVEDGKADVGTSTHYSAVRAKQVYFTYPWSIIYNGFIVKKGFDYTGPASLKGHQLGSISGYNTIPNMQKYYGGSDVHIFTDIAEQNSALQNGQVTAVLTGYQTFLEYRKQYPDFEWYFLKNGDVGMGSDLISTTSNNFVKCGNEPLATALNATMTKLQSTGAWKKDLKAAGILPNAKTIAPLVQPKQFC